MFVDFISCLNNIDIDDICRMIEDDYKIKIPEMFNYFMKFF